MPVPRKYPDDLRERATRMTMETRRNSAVRPMSIARTSDRSGIDHETLRYEVVQAEADGEDRPGAATEQARVWPKWSA